MRLQPIAVFVMMAGLLPTLGCWGGGMLAPEHGDPVGLWGPEMIAAPHPRFHAAPTRPVFAPPLLEFIDAAPPGDLGPAVPPELLAPPPAPSPETERAAPDDAAGDLPEPGILPPPETPLPRASSRRVPGMEYF